MHRINARGLALIKEFEGCRLSAYPDPGTGGEPWTIGFGHTEGVGHDDKISQGEADELLLEDVEEFEIGLNNLLGNSATNDSQFSAMLCLIYNIGVGNFAKSTVLKRHRLGNYLGASRAFVLWNKAAGHAMSGLTRRREAEARLYRGESA